MSRDSNRSVADKSWSELCLEAEETLLSIGKTLPSRVDPASQPVLHEVAYKYLVYREALFWRSYELGQGACAEARSNRCVNSVTLARSHLECSSALYFVAKTVKRAIQERNVDGLDKRAMRLLLGNKWEDSKHDSINVLTFLDRLDQEVPGVRTVYNDLSEYAHPNWLGTQQPFAMINKEQFYTNFGKRDKNDTHIKKIALYSLMSSLNVFKHFYKELSDTFPDFNDLCKEMIG